MTASQKLRAKPTGTYSLAGAWPKVAATVVWELTGTADGCAFVGDGVLKNGNDQAVCLIGKGPACKAGQVGSTPTTASVRDVSSAVGAG